MAVTIIIENFSATQTAVGWKDWEIVSPILSVAVFLIGVWLLSMNLNLVWGVEKWYSWAGGPKLRKWYGAPDLFPKEGGSEEDDEDDESDGEQYIF